MSSSILLAIILFISSQPNRIDKIYKGKENEDVYVSVEIESRSHIKFYLDDYLLGVVAGEMPASFELEAIKAQVVASRTFVYSRLLSVDNTTNTQVYLDDEKMKVSWNEHYEEYKEKVKKAIKETKGGIITYQGECISALFYSSSNGKSENVENYFIGSCQTLFGFSRFSLGSKSYDPQFLRRNKNFLKHFFEYKCLNGSF